MPVIEGALGMIKKETNVNKIPGSLSLYEIQKTCTLKNNSSFKKSTVNMNGKVTPESMDET